jgi:RNA polymerase sigma-70 factor (ECF subfamily)
MSLDGQTREAFFTRLFEANYSAVRAYAWRRRPDTADDVASETFVIAWQQLERVPHTPLPWLIGVARNVQRNTERGELRRRQWEMRSASSECGDCGAESVGTDGSLAGESHRPLRG